MNLIHMKYALAVAETKSINKAADDLFVGAPALSRAIKELENGLGVTLFERSAKGMFLTPDGELFVGYAKKILSQVDDVESLFKDGSKVKETFSISVPRASYVATAFARFVQKVPSDKDVKFFYKETNAYRVINNILKDDYKLGILRYGNQYDDYYKSMMESKHLKGELINEFNYVLIMNKDCALAKADEVSLKDLDTFTEIAHADPYVPSLPLQEVEKDELPEHDGNRVFVFERGSQFELLANNSNAYMWVSPVPKETLDRYGLVERECADNNRVYRDVLVCRKDYKLSKLDNAFIEELIKVKREVFK